jgi:16S rRNA (guanine1207-N2)-methyltransferase
LCLFTKPVPVHGMLANPLGMGYARGTQKRRASGRIARQTMSRTLLYGEIPIDLVPVPSGSEQVSPLVPGSTALEDIPPASCDGLFMRAPPNTMERRREVALALRALRPGAPLVILAAKDKGGARLAKELAAFGIDVSDQPRHHHRICAGVCPETLNDIDDALAEGALRLRADIGFASQPGLFSWDRVDGGTAALLAVLPRLVGRVGDFGCGCGHLSKAVRESDAVTSVTGFDIDRRALAAARQNIKDLRFTTVWVDLAARGAGVTNFDAIVMNPPFHHAGVEDQALGQALIARAADALRPGGVLWLTANRHLPYEAVLKARFKAVRLVSEAHGFKVYQATR